MKNMNNFIDLSNLPHRPNGNYNWEKSEGMTLKFHYNNIDGYIDVLSYDKTTGKLNIFIENYTSKDGIFVHYSQIRKCILGKVLKPKIISTHPHLIQYLDDPDDALKYTSGSAKRVWLVCPFCNNKKHVRVCDLVNYGFHCDMCGDGFSYPNKFMKSLLTQLGIKFIAELSCATAGFEWVQSYKYDFYCELDNKEYIIEMDGGFHFKNTFNMLLNVQNSDRYKNQLAKQHNIEVIRIDCNYRDLDQRFDYIVANILNSPLNDLLNLSNHEVDWNKCDLDATRTILLDICELWNSHYSIINIANKLNISPVTVRTYLRHGTKLELTYYNGNEERSKRRAEFNREMAQRKKQPIALYKDQWIVGVFASCADLSIQSITLFNKKFNASVLYKAVNGNIKHAYGYTIRRITKYEFEKYIEEHNNMLAIGGDDLGLAV